MLFLQNKERNKNWWNLLQIIDTFTNYVTDYEVFRKIVRGTLGNCVFYSVFVRGYKGTTGATQSVES
jgi:hypothetical protein